MEKVVRLESVNKTDADVAKEIRERLVPLLAQVCACMDEAKKNNIEVAFNISPDGTGVHRVSNLKFLKVL